MAFIGSFLVPDMDFFNEFDWTSVPMPRDVRGATDLGGNALVATAGTDNPDLAAEFLKFMASSEAMTAFCAGTNELPTRVDIEPGSIEFAVRPDVMPVFVEQATVIEPDDVRQLTSPAMAAINVALQDELEAAFVGGQSTADTLSNLADAIADATSG
jgi:multiple sugar transport system substrate-binding protein